MGKLCSATLLLWLLAASAGADQPAIGEGFIEVPGGPVWYHVAGEGAGVPLLALHGGPGGTSCGFGRLEILGDQRPVVRYDQLGSGRSGRPDDASLWTVDRFVEELHTVRQRLGLERMHLLGHSWGGTLAAAYVLEKGTAGIVSLTLSSPLLSTPAWVADANLLRKQLPAEVQEVLAEHEAAGTTDSEAYAEASKVFYERFVYAGEEPPEPPECAGAPWNESVYKRMWGPTEFHATGTLVDFDLTPRLGEIDVPVLFLAGEFDEARPETVAGFQQLIPGARLEVIEGVAHASLAKAPERYAAVLEAFLDEAEEDPLTALAREHRLTMAETDSGFTGSGWDFLSQRIADAEYVLVGEDHFTNEIPRFVEAAADVAPFDNFYIEVDPFSTRIIERSIRDPGAAERDAFRREYGDLYSFYALEPEYRLLEKLVEGGAGLLGSDQVVMYADRLVFQDWLARTDNAEARKIYRHVVEQSKQALERFLENPAEPKYHEIYFMTPAFAGDLEALSQLALSAGEQAAVDAMRRSVDIYTTQSHRKRVQLIKHQLIEDYPRWAGQRTLFKYGANHLARGESFLTVPDIGNLVANLAEARYEQSFHVMVLGESGSQGSPFRGFPATPVDPGGFYLKHLQPLFALTEGAEWSVFDLVPLRRAYEKGELALDDRNLVRSLKGYDALVLIPAVTPAAFPAR